MMVVRIVRCAACADEGSAETTVLSVPVSTGADH